MDRFTHHLVKTSPATESSSFSGIAADKVSDITTKTICLIALHGQHPDELVPEKNSQSLTPYLSEYYSISVINFLFSTYVRSIATLPTALLR